MRSQASAAAKRAEEERAAAASAAAKRSEEERAAAELVRLEDTLMHVMVDLLCGIMDLCHTRSKSVSWDRLPSSNT